MDSVSYLFSGAATQLKTLKLNYVIEDLRQLIWLMLWLSQCSVAGLVGLIHSLISLASKQKEYLHTWVYRPHLEGGRTGYVTVATEPELPSY